MGLDISAVRRAELLHKQDDCQVEGDHYPDDVRCGYPNYDFPGRADGLVAGCYRYGTSFGFRAGSYSGYNLWREQLAKMAHGVPIIDIWKNPTTYKGTSFHELIEFSDCEGMIGPMTSAKLARDFRDHQTKAEQFWAGDEWGLQKYRDWAKAFYLAADNGFVSFH